MALILGFETGRNHLSFSICVLLKATTERRCKEREREEEDEVEFPAHHNTAC